MSSLAAHEATLRDMPCVVATCGQFGVELHHACGGSMKFRGVHKGKGQRTSDWFQMPLCKDHHTGKNGIHTGVETWESRFGGQAAIIDRLSLSVGVDLWKKATEQMQKTIKQRVYRKSKKINARVA